MKDVTFSPLEKMVTGLDIAANAVGGTLGPRGGNVFFDDPMQPEVTNDGATIANKITLPDKLENMGAWLVKNTSSQTNDDAGDGTTTTAVLLQAVVHECLKRPENPVEVKESLQAAVLGVLKTLSKKSIKLNRKDVERVALVSAENPLIARLVAEVIKKLGEKVVINVEDSKGFDTSYDIVEGYDAKVGFLSPYFVNESKTGRAVYTDVPVFVSEKKISNVIDIKPLFDQFQQQGISSCVIVCEEIEDSMLGVFVANKLAGRFNAVVVRATGPLLLDIEAVVGAKRVSDATGVTFQNISLQKHVGKAKKVVSTANSTLFIASNPSTKEYALQLEKAAENDPNMFSSKKLRDRVAKLRGGVAVLKIGAPTDLEREYLKRKAEDAVKATQAALEEGIVEGGGMALWRIAHAMKPKTIGEHILKRALSSPLQRIVKNAGKDYSEIVLRLTDKNGYDAKRDMVCGLVEAGIIDPTKVERCALENAVSSAATFVTTFCSITDHYESKE